MSRARLELLQWFALLGGPLAWTTQHVSGFGLSDAGCYVAGAQWDLNLSLLQIVLAAALGCVVLAAEAAALLVLRATGEADRDDPGPAGRLHFFAQAAALGNVLFLVIVLLDVVGAVYQLPCRQA